MEAILILIFLMLWPSPLHSPPWTGWVVWNVGQGEWVTRVEERTCTHFDMGGEKFPAAALRKFCGGKENRAHFSHWDLDHVGFARKARMLFPHLCLATRPIGSTTWKKEQLFDGWARCPHSDEVLAWSPPLPTKPSKSNNELCHIYRAENVLIPGDAPSRLEKLYLSERPYVKSIQYLILGHHGSRTSTSENLLNSLPNLRIAIATARHAKYGHPHVEVEMRLRRHHVALLTTEDWGSILIQD